MDPIVSDCLRKLIEEDIIVHNFEQKENLDELTEVTMAGVNDALTILLPSLKRLLIESAMDFKNAIEMAKIFQDAYCNGETTGLSKGVAAVANLIKNLESSKTPESIDALIEFEKCYSQAKNRIEEYINLKSGKVPEAEEVSTSKSKHETEKDYLKR